MIDSFIDQLNNKDLSLDDRCSAILSLVKFYDDQCFDPLTAVLNNIEELTELRSAAALGLAKLGRKSLPELKKYIKDQNTSFRNYVVQAIGMIGEEALPVLVKALKDQNNEVFYTAADAIAAIGDPAVPHLTNLLENGKEDAKCVAAWKLGELKDTRAVPALINAIKDNENNEDILSLCIWALGEVSRKKKNDKSILSALYRASRTDKPELKRHAYIALRKARDYVN